MDVGLHHFSQSRIYQPVALQRRQAGEFRTGNVHLEMSTAITGTSMADMMVTFIDNFENRRLQLLLQPLLHLLDAPARDFCGRAHQGKTRLKGLTSTLA